MDLIEISKLTGLELFKRYSFNHMPFYVVERWVPPLPIEHGVLVNIRSLRIWDRDLSIVNVRFSHELISSVLVTNPRFIVQKSFPRAWNVSTNTALFVQGRIELVEVVMRSGSQCRVETRDIADGRVRPVKLTRWRALRSAHLEKYGRQLRDLEIILANGSYVVEFNTTSRLIGTEKSQIIFWEILPHS